jgi:hypothetical protein
VAVEKLNMKKKIERMSNFLEDMENGISGLTRTYKNGKIKNYLFEEN